LFPEICHARELLPEQFNSLPNLNQGEDQMKQLTVHLDAVAIIALVFLASLGMNVWQFLNNRELMQKYVDAEWELGNSRANVVYTRSLFKACNPDKHDDHEIKP
jgi:hypothetical protein